MDEIRDVNMDFKGQTIFEKLEDGVSYYVNPLRLDSEDEVEEIRKLNQQIEVL